MRNRINTRGRTRSILSGLRGLAILLWLCSPALLPAIPPEATTPPKDVNAILEKAVSLDPDVDPQALSALIQMLDENKSRAGLVWHKGKIVAEWYDYGTDAGTQQECWSLTKSFASTAIGLLIDEGKIGGIDDHVSKYVPSWNQGQKADVTIAHLLEHTSGLKDIAGLTAPADLLQRCLDAELLSAPGTVKHYNNAGCNVLSAVISAAAGKDPEKYMSEKVFKPIGMNDTTWRRDAGGNVITYAGLQSTPRDLAKFGELFLNGGKWNGKKIISKKWIDLATSPRSDLDIALTDQKSKYGLLWWVDRGRESGVPHSYSALGLWGNNLTVIPDEQLIGVRLVGNASEGGKFMNLTGEWIAALGKVIKTNEAKVAAKSEKKASVK